MTAIGLSTAIPPEQSSRDPEFKIGSKLVGKGHPTYFIADIGANHDGDMDRALDLIGLCAEAGADAAKFQNFKAETIVSESGFEALGSRIGHQASWDESVLDVYRKAALPESWTSTLQEACTRAGIDYLTTPYDLDLIPLLAPYVVAWKIGSGDITWNGLIEAVSSYGKPVLLATGASDMGDVRRAVSVAAHHSREIVLMQCNTNYTGDAANFDHLALNVLKTYEQAFPGCVLGLSDHTPGHTSVLGAVTLGARVIEKHFTDDRSRKGPDHGFALDPSGWADMVQRTRELERALGPSVKQVMPNEYETSVVQRRALRAKSHLKAGTVLGPEHLVALRPCPSDGVAPYRVNELIGRVLASDICVGDLVTTGHLR